MAQRKPHTQTSTRRVRIAPERAAIWPRRSAPCLPRAVFKAAFAEARHTLSAFKPKRQKPSGIAAAIAAALTLCREVGLPDLWEANTEAPRSVTLLQLDQTVRGLVVRLIHRKHGCEDRLNKAADALADLIEILGGRVSFRDMTHAPNMGGWRVNLRVAPFTAAPALALRGR